MTDDPIGRLETDDSPAIPSAWNEASDTQEHTGAREPDVTRLREEVGFAPTTTLADGLARTIDWWRERPER